MNLLKNSNKKAFSLIELSIVILIIGIIIAGITKSTRILDLYRLSSARSQTQSSPVNSIEDLVVWYDSTMEDSFDENETDDYDTLSAAEITLGKGVISTWYDISSTTGVKDNLTQSTLSLKPQYKAKCINDLPCVYFDGTDDLLSFTGNSINGIVGSNYTIFIVEKKDDTDDAMRIIIGSSASKTFHLGYKDNDEVTWGHTLANNYATFTAGSVTLTDNNPVLHVFVNESIDGFETDTEDNFFKYTNGSSTIETKTDVGTTGNSSGALASYASQTVGAGLVAATTYYYKGAIGEIIIFKRALKAQERDAIEDYLIKKWQIKPDNS